MGGERKVKEYLIIGFSKGMENWYNGCILDLSSGWQILLSIHSGGGEKMTSRGSPENEFFRVVLDANPDFMLVVDEDVRIIEFNRAAGLCPQCFQEFRGEIREVEAKRSGEAVN